VTFTRDVLLTTRSRSGSEIVWSSRASFDSQAGSLVRFPTSKFAELDTNFDGRNDLLRFEIRMPVPTDFDVVEITLALGFRARMNVRLPPGTQIAALGEKKTLASLPWWASEIRSLTPGLFFSPHLPSPSSS
jgi:hypothetical protein